MGLLVIFLLITGLLFWLLIAPLELSIRTEQNDYALEWKSIGRVEIIPVTDDIVIRLKVLFFRKDFYPLQYQPQKKDKTEKKTKKKKKKKRAGSWGWQKIKKKGLRLLRSFEVKAFKLDLDTDDFVLNSYLFPIFYLTGNKNITINYEGRSSLTLIIQNRPYKILLAILLY